jgi:hypothetical protein
MYDIVKEGRFKLSEMYTIQFISAKGVKYGEEKKSSSLVEDNWEVLVDLERRLAFLSEIVVTNL